MLAVSSAQEIAAKHKMSGSVKLVYAIVYALFLGFSLDFGSSMYLLFDRYQSTLQRPAITSIALNCLTSFLFLLTGCKFLIPELRT